MNRDLEITEEELLDALPLLPAVAPISSFYPPVVAQQPNTDPSWLGFPPMLAMEIAMRTAPVEEIVTGYGLNQDEWERLSVYPPFVRAVQTATEQLQEEGVSFKIKAKLQADALLSQSWKMIHDPLTPHAVRADLLKSTIRWAGHDSRDAALTPGTALQININMGGSRDKA